MASFAGCNIVQPVEGGAIKIKITITNAVIDTQSGDLSFDGSYQADFIDYDNGFEEIINSVNGTAQGLVISADAGGGGNT